MLSFTSRSVAVLGVLLACSVSTAEAPRGAVDYLTQVKPIFKARCLACHGALKQEAGLRLDTGASIRQGGDSGPAVIPGDADGSYLLQRISAEDPSERMPPEGEPLTAEQIGLIRAWIEQNAASPADEAPEPDPRDHWAFRPVNRPEIPKSPRAATTSNPIDAYIDSELQRRGLVPLGPARPEQLLRRVYLDLIGLPPTRDELHAWLQNPSPEAYAAIVDDLLSRPQYGERWARHWMDVWRYSDWYGRRSVPDVWNSAPQVWRWRDWIVRSLNEDKGYDEMVRQMLAADELYPGDYENLVATGYLVRNWFALNANQWMRDNVEHTGKAFLGLTLNCAHCHDHKYDPITQDEYFAFRAFFEPIGIRQDRVVGEPEPGPYVEYEYLVLRKVQRLGSVGIFDKQPDAPTWFYTGGDERNRVESRRSIPPAVPAALAGSGIEIEAVELPPTAYYPGLRPEIQQMELAAAAESVRAAEAALEAARSAHSEPELAELRQKVTEAEQALVAARSESGHGALRGRQSLVLDATTGRRIINNNLANLFPLESGAQIRVELLLVRDAHFNIQLAKDTQAGLTAGLVAFEGGNIQSYQPGSFNVFQCGTYNLSAGQNRLEVLLTVDRDGDRCLLSVRSLNDDQVLVDGVPVALNGWNPAGNPLQALTLDARLGAVVAVDDVVLRSAKPLSDGTGVVTFDFEPPQYADGQDVVGVQGWTASQFSQAGAKSAVVQTIDSQEMTAERQALDLARSALAVRELPLRLAEARLAAAQAADVSVRARIEADLARYGTTPAAEAEPLIRKASLVERSARVAAAEADLIASQLAHAQAMQLPADDKERTAKLDSAAKQMSDAEAALAAARTALEDPAQAAKYTPFSPMYPTQSTGRRKALAQWIASRENPLTPRVAVNHIWMRHFHVPLVETVFDFGRNGTPPTHPHLLDWLAAEFIDRNWSMKHLHRLIVTSAAYCRTSRPEASGAAAAEDLERNLTLDPDNRYLWRMNVGRMETEAVRDSLLAVSRRLDLTMGGQELENTEALTTFRRSLYYSCHPETGGTSEFGRLFDAPDGGECYRRTRTVVPQQALALTNSELIHKCSAELETLLYAEAAGADEPESAFIVRAFEEILTRGPTESEAQQCREFLERQREQLKADGAADPAAAARASLLRVLFNHNDFVTIR